ncbi:hypothetical protein EV141_1122 [Microcella putealis]|uniref:DUF2304 domain-containing protein n=1 Tax=Microcella putealis TaxID=337005 RepID=A0A4V2EWW5_9MICO|nr:DUF2304 domain-containing protein [Microcella putealis]RZS57410.1 hypothetical protein EV141_1122 [Microcella putealis]TQM19447.1 hypothetical protein BJ957_2269 [Microcella putealis]
MSTFSYILGIVAASFTFIIVIDMLRRQRLRERHAIWWITGAILALIVGIFPALLDAIAAVIGIDVPINLVFFVSIAILVLVCIQHSAELTKTERQIRVLVEESALLSKRVRDLEDRA